MIGDELKFKPLVSHGVGRDHDPRVVDQEIDARQGVEGVRGKVANATQVRQVQFHVGTFCAGMLPTNVSDGLFRLLFVSTRQNNVCIFLCETQSGVKANPTVRTRDDGGALILQGNIGLAPRHFLIPSPIQNGFTFCLSLEKHDCMMSLRLDPRCDYRQRT